MLSTRSRMTFGQLIIGPPGSGKTTYCTKFKEFLEEKCKRQVSIINLDPANENMMYKPDIDIMDLVKVEDVMDIHDLGPNGALMFCMEYLETNFDWLLDKLKNHDGKYLLFDMPGQVELYTHHETVRNIFKQLVGKQYNYHLCCVHLIDSHYCSEPHKFISTLLMTFSTMFQIGLPPINVLSKGDELKKFASQLDFGIDFYAEVLDLKYLVECLNVDTFTSKFCKLNESIASIVQNFGLVSFLLLDWNNMETVTKLKHEVDKANGYVYGSGEERSIQSLLSCAVGAHYSLDYSELINK